MNQFEAPVLDEEGIGSAVHSGLLGEQISHVTVEQLKVASPALILQVCVSILQKLDIETDHFGQNFLQPYLSSPEHYQSSTFFLAHVPRYFHFLVPGCTPKVLCTLDLLRPKWKKIRRFLSVVINYMRFVLNNDDKFQELNIKSEELHRNVLELEDNYNKLHLAVIEIDSYMKKNASLYQQQNKEKIEAEEELKQILLVKEDTDCRKEESKKCLENLKSTLNNIENQNDQVLKKIDDVKQLIVTSPEKQVSEKKDLHRQLEMLKDEVSEVQDQLQSEQWNIDKKEQIIKRIGYALKQLSKYQEFYEKFRTIKAGLMKEQFQTNDDNMSLVCIKQEIDKLKQLKADERDQIHRTKLKTQHISASQKQRLQDINKQIELLQLQAQDKAEQIRLLHGAMVKQDDDFDKENQRHEEIIKKVEAAKTELVKLVEQSFTNLQEHIKDISSQRKQVFQINVDSKMK